MTHGTCIAATASMRALPDLCPICFARKRVFLRARRSGAIAVSLVGLIQPLRGFVVNTSVRPQAVPSTSGGTKTCVSIA